MNEPNDHGTLTLTKIQETKLLLKRPWNKRIVSLIKSAIPIYNFILCCYLLFMIAWHKDVRKNIEMGYYLIGYSRGANNILHSIKDTTGSVLANYNLTRHADSIAIAKDIYK